MGADIDFNVTANPESHQEACLATTLDALSSGSVPCSLSPSARLSTAWEHCGRGKSEAVRLGMLRPWALIVTMLPSQREAMAQSLGIEDFRVVNEEVPGAEALDILVRQKKGVGHRATGTFSEIVNRAADSSERMSCWIIVLVRVLSQLKVEIPPNLLALGRRGQESVSSTRTESNRASRNLSDGSQTPVGQLERLYLETIQERWLAGLDDGDRQSVAEATANIVGGAALEAADLTGLEPLLVLAGAQDGTFRMANVGEKLQAAGSRILLTHAIKVVAPLVGTLVMATNITRAVLGANPLGCEDVITATLLHRVSLAAQGIHIEDVVENDPIARLVNAADAEAQNTAEDVADSKVVGEGAQELVD